MIRTQIQLPDELYRQTKRFADEREISLTEAIRRGIMQLLETHPPSVTTSSAWELPKPRNLGCRNLTAPQLRDLGRGEEEIPSWIHNQSKKRK